MSGALTATEKNAILNAEGTKMAYASAHTADPGSTGTSEATGGSPAYARKPVAWNAASAGAMTASTLPTFDVPAGTYGWIGFWSAVTGGTYYGKQTITSQTFAGQDVLPVAAITWDLNATASA